MPLYRDLARGYEVVYQPSNGYLYPTHRLADEWNLRNGFYSDRPRTHRHRIASVGRGRSRLRSSRELRERA